MPFTLAHPAAVLPLRGRLGLRIVPLILGALVPDAQYYMPGALARTFPENHTFTGSYTSGLALGYALLALLVVLRHALTALLPLRARALCLGALAPYGRSAREWALAAPAIVLGAWTHLAWDSFTHGDGLMVRRVAALSAPVDLLGYQGTVAHLLQYLSSVLGVVVLAAWYQRLPVPACAAPPPAAPPALPVLLLVTAAATLIGAVQATAFYGGTHQFYRTMNVLLTRSVAWFGALYLLAGAIVALEQRREPSR